MSAKIIKKIEAKEGPKRRTSKSLKAGLFFPISRISNRLKQSDPANHVSFKSPVFLAAVLEYLTAEVLEIAGDAARALNKKQITPTHIQIAMRNDEELDKLLDKGTISSAGNFSILPTKPVKKEENDSNL
ncbi:unnamed protein product [Blepharisma stoltei]|uniref:Histone H2A n=1 Tax=Blepharisma stoltei TaxID=1481888 RepID=A0AAU9K0X9_9CILI|nr:unnamed protein product [Blepharisma stoltei]